MAIVNKAKSVPSPATIVIIMDSGEVYPGFNNIRVGTPEGGY